MSLVRFTVTRLFARRPIRLAASAVTALAGFALLGALSARPALAASIVVNSLGDTVADDGTCTLREAIDAANLNTASGGMSGECAAGDDDPTVDVITFSVSGTIAVGSALPGIGDGGVDDPGYVTIDGDNNDDMVPDIVLDRNLGGGIGILVGRSTVTSSSVTIRGLEIREFGGPGIDLIRVTSTVVEDTYVHAGESQGIRIQHDSTTGVTIRRVRIGLDSSGAASGNDGNGVQINDGADSVTIEDSFIAANDSDGIQVAGGGGTGTGHIIRNNVIGTDLAGTTCGPSGGNPPWNTYGNGLIGIDILGGMANSTIEDNVIACSGRTQTVGGSQGDGIEITGGGSDDNTIQDNYIGTNSSGADLGNHQSGIDIAGGDNTTITGNTIAFNGVIATSSHQDGIEIGGTTTDGHTITQNSIHSNDGLGIDLGPDGVAGNDTNDSDSGSNELQNYPVINSAANNGLGEYDVNYTWSFAAGEGPWTIEFYCNADGGTQGRTYQASVVIPGGSPTGTQTSSFTPVPGTCNTTLNVITATATNSDAFGGSTSEFSASFDPTAVTLTRVGVTAGRRGMVGLAVLLAAVGAGIWWRRPRRRSRDAA